MVKRLESRLEALERATTGDGKHIFAIQDSDNTVYSDCFGERRRHYTVAEWMLLYPGAKIIDFRELNKAVQEATESKADGKEA